MNEVEEELQKITRDYKKEIKILYDRNIYKELWCKGGESPIESEITSKAKKSNELIDELWNHVRSVLNQFRDENISETRSLHSFLYRWTEVEKSLVYVSSRYEERLREVLRKIYNAKEIIFASNDSIVKADDVDSSNRFQPEPTTNSYGYYLYYEPTSYEKEAVFYGVTGDNRKKAKDTVDAGTLRKEGSITIREDDIIDVNDERLKKIICHSKYISKIRTNMLKKLEYKITLLEYLIEKLWDSVPGILTSKEI